MEDGSDRTTPPTPGDTSQGGVGDGSDRTDLGSGSGLPGLACLSASQKAWDGQRCLPVGSASETTVHQHLESNKATDKLCRPQVPCVCPGGRPPHAAQDGRGIVGPTSDLPSWQGPGSLGPGGWFLFLEPRDEMNPVRGDRDEFSWESALWGKRRHTPPYGAHSLPQEQVSLLPPHTGQTQPSTQWLGLESWP